MKRHRLYAGALAALLLPAAPSQANRSPLQPAAGQMMYADASRGRAFSKDPHVIHFKNRDLLY